MKINILNFCFQVTNIPKPLSTRAILEPFYIAIGLSLFIFLPSALSPTCFGCIMAFCFVMMFVKCTSDKGLSSVFRSDLSKGTDLLFFGQLVMGVTNVQK
jgi:hypothetical protein